MNITLSQDYSLSELKNSIYCAHLRLRDLKNQIVSDSKFKSIKKIKEGDYLYTLNGLSTLKCKEFGLMHHEYYKTERKRLFYSDLANAFHDKLTWEAINKRRCLIPVKDYEVRINGKRPFRVKQKESKLFLLAAIGDTWRDEEQKKLRSSICLLLAVSPQNLSQYSAYSPIPIGYHFADFWSKRSDRESIDKSIAANDFDDLIVEQI